MGNGLGRLFESFCKKHSLLVKRVPVKVKDGQGTKTLQVPFYSPLRVKPFSCSAFVRMAAEEIFGKKYSFSDAWDRRYNDVLVSDVDGNSLEQLARQGTLQPGMVVGIFNPYSHSNRRQDQTGSLVQYTHVGLYLGESPNEEPLIADQYGPATRIKTENEIRAQGLVPKEIINSRNKDCRRL